MEKTVLKTSFLITSAINSKFGIFDPKARMEDTIKTIESIYNHVLTEVKCNVSPNECDIILIDMCADGLTKEQKAILTPLVKEVVDYSKVPDVQEIYKSPSQDIVKNVTETICFCDFLHKRNFSEYDFVFKISGRYKLNNNFDIEWYRNNKANLVFSGIYSSQFSPECTGNPPNQNYQMMSRLWSFNPKIINQVREAYKNMFRTMLDRINNGGYIDIEHCLYKHMPEELIVFKTPIGLTGGIAPNGMIVND